MLTPKPNSQKGERKALGLCGSPRKHGSSLTPQAQFQGLGEDTPPGIRGEGTASSCPAQKTWFDKGCQDKVTREKDSSFLPTVLRLSYQSSFWAPRRRWAGALLTPTSTLPGPGCSAEMIRATVAKMPPRHQDQVYSTEAASKKGRVGSPKRKQGREDWGRVFAKVLRRCSEQPSQV